MVDGCAAFAIFQEVFRSCVAHALVGHLAARIPLLDRCVDSAAKAVSILSALPLNIDDFVQSYLKGVSALLVFEHGRLVEPTASPAGGCRQLLLTVSAGECVAEGAFLPSGSGQAAMLGSRRLI